MALACLLAAAGMLLGPGAEANCAATEARAKAPVAIEQAIRDCANRHRRAAGLEPLRASGVLAKAARLHARNMAAHAFFDHTDQQGRGPAERVEIFDRAHTITLIGENIAAGYSSVAVACRGWMNSSGHRANILGDEYTLIGGGFARGGPYSRYYVQVFGRGSGTERKAAR